MSGFLEKCNEVGNRFSGLLGAAQVVLTCICGFVIWGGTLYLNVNYVTKAEDQEQQFSYDNRFKSQEQQFEVIKNQLNTIIQGQISVDGKIQLINTILNSYGTQFTSFDERIRYIERQKNRENP